MGRRSRFGLSLAAGVLVSVAFVTASTTPSPADVSRRLTAVARELEERLSDSAAYRGMAFPRDDSVTVYWAGEPPAEVTQLIEAASGARAVGITVDQPDFGMDELGEEGARLAGRYSGDFPSVVTASPRADLSGIDLQVAPAAWQHAVDQGLDLRSVIRSRIPVRIVGEATVAVTPLTP